MMQRWFTDAKFGIFLHYGIYAVKGVPESWSLFNKQLTYDEYYDQLGGFTAADYDPEEWCDLFVRAGARYAVLTSKHHDGVALYDTAHSDLNVVNKTPAGRDLVTPYVQACRKYGLHVGLYFSHLDWAHPDYAPLPVGQRFHDTLTGEAYEAWEGGPGNPAWQRFLAFQRGQIKELIQRFHPELLWFDGDWSPDDRWWNMAETRAMIDGLDPNVICNSRLQGHGDYATPEQGQPVRRPEGPWEYCLTMNDSWGYQHHDHNYKSTRELVRVLCECAGMGGNVLLAVTPMENGRLPQAQIDRLEAMGTWLDVNGEAIYGTSEGLPGGLFYGSSTVSEDRTALYLHLYDQPRDAVAVKGLATRVRRASVLGGPELKMRRNEKVEWSGVPSTVWVEVPEAALDPLCTVIKLELEGPLELNLGPGRD